VDRRRLDVTGLEAGQRARGRCPDCGRILAGRADGIERRAADKRFVLLPPHVRDPHAAPRAVCLPPYRRARVPRVTIDPAAAPPAAAPDAPAGAGPSITRARLAGPRRRA
jgi:hypothetical protein